MAPTHASIVERVRQAIRDAPISQTELASRVGMDPTALSKSLNGGRHFTPIELATIAEETGVTVTWLLSTDDTPSPATLIAARVQPEADPVMQQAQTRIDDFVEVNDLLVRLGYRPRPPRFEGLLREHDNRPPDEQGHAIAEELRARLDHPQDLPLQLDGLAAFVEERLGIDVAFEPLDSGLDGMSLVRGDFRLVLIGTGTSATRQRFTLGHEIGHIAAGDSQSLKVDHNVSGNRSDHSETRANAFSAAFLMPRQAIIEATDGKMIDEELIAGLLGRFRVSLDALALRLKHCGVLDRKETERVRRMSSARIAMRQGRTDDLRARNGRRQPGLLLRRSVDAYIEAAISIRPVARVLQVEPELLLDELAPPQHPTSLPISEVPAL
jgi:Zn-dependent peptidase ImmA (M78 family)/transcriptional regulator with XRE-family HTH domain